MHRFGLADEMQEASAREHFIDPLQKTGADRGGASRWG